MGAEATVLKKRSCATDYRAVCQPRGTAISRAGPGLALAHAASRYHRRKYASADVGDAASLVIATVSEPHDQKSKDDGAAADQLGYPPIAQHQAVGA